MQIEAIHAKAGIAIIGVVIEHDIRHLEEALAGGMFGGKTTGVGQGGHGDGGEPMRMGLLGKLDQPRARAGHRSDDQHVAAPEGALGEYPGKQGTLGGQIFVEAPSERLVRPPGIVIVQHTPEREGGIGGQAAGAGDHLV